MDARMNWQDQAKAGMTVNGCEGLAEAHVIRPGPIDFSDRVSLSGSALALYPVHGDSRHFRWSDYTDRFIRSALAAELVLRSRNRACLPRNRVG